LIRLLRKAGMLLLSLYITRIFQEGTLMSDPVSSKYLVPVVLSMTYRQLNFGLLSPAAASDDFTRFLS